MSGLFRCLCLCLLLSVGWMGLPGVAHAGTTCTASVTGGLDFGTVDPELGRDSSTSIGYSCTANDIAGLILGATADICLNIGNGASGLAASGRRRMAGPGAAGLEYQLYADPAHQAIAGSIDTPATPDPIRVTVHVPPWGGTGTGTVQLYGSIPGGQSSVSAGHYSSTFGAGQVRITHYKGNRCTDAQGDADNFSSFPVQADIQPTCTVTADTLDFGTARGFLDANIDQTSQILVRCVNGTMYEVGLDNGQHASGTARQMAGPDGARVQYELYRNPGRNLRWGATPGADTVDRKAGNTADHLTVYGRVPPQATTAPAGSYSDTVTVSITY